MTGRDRRYLIAVGSRSFPRLGDGWELPEVDDELQAIEGLFVGDLGYRRVLRHVGQSPTSRAFRSALERWFASPARREDDLVVLYYTGHGLLGRDRRHYLCFRNTTQEGLERTAFPTEDLARLLIGSKVRHLLVLLDTCWAQQGMADAVAVADRILQSLASVSEAEPSVFFVSAARYEAQPTIFADGLCRAVRDPRGGWLDESLDLGRIVEAIVSECRLQGISQSIRWAVPPNPGPCRPLVNPRYGLVPRTNRTIGGRRVLSRDPRSQAWRGTRRPVGEPRREKRKLLGAGLRRSIRSAVASADAVSTPIPDILTPAPSLGVLVSALEPVTGAGLAARLAEHSHAAVNALEVGAFDLFLAIGEGIQADGSKYPRIQAVGEYFIGEGYRLRADMAPPSEKPLLANLAMGHLTTSLDRDKANPRVLRAVARLAQVNHDLDTALEVIHLSKDLASKQMSLAPTSESRRGLSHEILRITRHHIDTILTVLSTNRLSTWHREEKKHELRNYVLESERLHQTNMPLFAQQERWSQFEWFAALLFLGKAWGAVGEPLRMVWNYVCALRSRRQMLEYGRPLTAVEFANLQWWVREVLAQGPTVTTASFHEDAQRLNAALDTGNSVAVLGAIDALLKPFRDPREISAA